VCEALALFLVQLGLIFLKAWQQRCVAGDHLVAAMFTPFLLAAAEILSIGIVASAFIEGNNLHIVWLAMSCGASLGVGAAIKTHQRLFRRAR